jgi:hypothetical protein
MTKTNETPKRQAAITVTPIDSANKEVPITEAVGLLFRSANGQTLYAYPDKLGDVLTPTLILHGLKQKLIDAAAISRDPETGRSATVADKWAAVEAVWQRLLAGEWNAQRGDGTGSGGLLFKALCRMYPTKTADDIRAWLAKQDDKAQAALRKNPKVAAIIDTIRAEQAKADDIDSDELLDELEG